MKEVNGGLKITRTILGASIGFGIACVVAVLVFRNMMMPKVPIFWPEAETRSSRALRVEAVQMSKEFDRDPKKDAVIEFEIILPADVSNDVMFKKGKEAGFEVSGYQSPQVDEYKHLLLRKKLVPDSKEFEDASAFVQNLASQNGVIFKGFNVF